MTNSMITDTQRTLIRGLAEELGMDDDALLALVQRVTGRESLERLRYTEAGAVRGALVRERTRRGHAAAGEGGADVGGD